MQGLSVEKILNRQQKRPKAKLEADHMSAFELGSQKLLAVEKRARKLLIRCFDDYEGFLQDLSAFLLGFLQSYSNNRSEIPVVVGPGLARTLTAPIQYSGSTPSETESERESERQIDGDRHAVLCFGGDDAIYRVLAHALCQFYGISSKSEAVALASAASGEGARGEGKKGKKSKSVLKNFIISRPLDSQVKLHIVT